MKTAIVLVALVLAPLMPATGATAAPAGCADGDVAHAAALLLHPGARVVALDEVAGFRSALASAPIVHPGVEMRLVRAGGFWCAPEALDAAWRLEGRAHDAVAKARAFAQLAAAPWMGEVTVTRAAQVVPGVVLVETHAPVNGIVATWQVVVGARGLTQASFTSTAFGVDASSYRWEGLVAVPGATRAWRLAEDGLLAPTQPIAPQLPAPAVTLVDRMSDGFRIQYNLGGGAAVCPDPGVEVGAQPADACSLTRRLVRENYEEFLSWGLRKGWTLPTGTVYIDDATALTCFACVVIAPTFQIHIHSAVMQYLAASGYRYEDEEQAYSLVLGHEMFHNFQNAYSKPASGVYMEGAYSEGLARFQETLHAYGPISHQPESLVYAPDANGCNAETGSPSRPFEFPSFSPVQWAGGDGDLASGPSTGQSYSACAFWMSWYGQHGIEGLRALLEASPTTRALAGWDEVRATIELATGAPVDDDLARFARALLTGDGLVWGPAAGAGPALDWGEHLGRWTPPTLTAPDSLDARLREGGMMGARLMDDATVTVSGAGVRLYVVRDDGAVSTVAPVASGARVTVADGEAVWVVALLPDVGPVDATLGVA